MSDKLTQEVRTHVTRLYCNCGEEMIRSNVALSTYPIKYSYYCEKCAYTEVSDTYYPKVTYEVINE